MTPTNWLPIIVSAILSIAGCATLQSDFDPPVVNVSSIRALPSDGFAPQFEIDLKITNPNRDALDLYGIAYNLILEGHKILTGVSKDLPTIDGYSEVDVTLIATANLLNSIGFFADLVKSHQESIDYKLEAKLDFGGFHPTIRVAEQGKVDLSGRTR